MKAQGSNLSERLKSRRKELGLSQTALAKACNVSQPTIANWERGGHVPRQAALNAIAEGLDVDPIWLLSGEMPPEKNPAHQHLSKTIRHIPIYEWPLQLDDLQTAQASDYMSMSVSGGDYLAIRAPKGDVFPGGTVLIFDRAADRVSGRYLAQSGERAEMVNLVLAANDDDDNLAEWTRYRPIGRLVLSVQPH